MYANGREIDEELMSHLVSIYQIRFSRGELSPDCDFLPTDRYLLELLLGMARVGARATLTALLTEPIHASLYVMEDDDVTPF